MRIAFSPHIFCLQTTGGISRYFCNLAEHLALAGEDSRVLAAVHRNEYLSAVSAPIHRGIRVNGPSRLASGVLRVSESLSRIDEKIWRPDVFHQTYYAEARSRKAPLIITVYDMIHERFPNQFESDPITRIKRESILSADHVICISESTRKDLLEFIDIKLEKTSVVLLGSNRLSINPPGVFAGGAKRPFLLFVGQRGGYKNFLSLLDAFASSPTLRSDFDLICFGGGAFGESEMKSIQRLQLTDRVHQMVGSDEDLAMRYSAAVALIYPSLFEGFGLPPLEAMNNDCAVVCSNTSSIPEIVGNAGEYFDPTDVGSIRVAIENVAYSTERRAALIQSGRERAKRFDWETCASETLDVYRKVVQ